MAHTKGPLSVEHYDMLKGMYEIQDAGEDEVGYAYERDDAELFAAALDLLAACKLALSVLVREGVSEFHAQATLRAAIARAEPE